VKVLKERQSDIYKALRPFLTVTTMFVMAVRTSSRPFVLTSASNTW